MPYRQYAGLTLVELLVVLSIVGVLATMAIPGFAGMVAANQRAATLNRFVTAIHYARSESLKRGREVAVCKTLDGETCAGSGADWSAGWMVFVNRDRDSPVVRDAGETLLRVFEATGKGMQISANRNAFSLRPYGRRSTNGTFTVCPRNAAVDPRAVIISVTGRPRISDRAADGSALSC